MQCDYRFCLADDRLRSCPWGLFACLPQSCIQAVFRLDRTTKELDWLSSDCGPTIAATPRQRQQKDERSRQSKQIDCSCGWRLASNRVTATAASAHIKQIQWESISKDRLSCARIEMYVGGSKAISIPKRNGSSVMGLGLSFPHVAPLLPHSRKQWYLSRLPGFYQRYNNVPRDESEREREREAPLSDEVLTDFPFWRGVERFLLPLRRIEERASSFCVSLAGAEGLVGV